MSNLDKVNSVANEWVESMGGLEAIRHDYGSDLSGLMQALDDARLLMPDLPRPTRDRLWQTSALELGFRTVHYAADQVVVYTPRGRLHTHYKQARNLALALLAAADYAEKEQGNEQFRES